MEGKGLGVRPSSRSGIVCRLTYPSAKLDFRRDCAVARVTAMRRSRTRPIGPTSGGDNGGGRGCETSLRSVDGIEGNGAGADKKQREQSANSLSSIDERKIDRYALESGIEHFIL